MYFFKKFFNSDDYIIPFNIKPVDRNDITHKLKNTVYDVLIIGGGITGAGCAIESIGSHLKTALIEKNDFASGTSGKSSKLLHGGVRYLEKAFQKFSLTQLKLVFEALHQRKDIMNRFPYSTKPIEIMVPLYHYISIPYYYLGLKIYDWLSWNKNLGYTKFLDHIETKKNFSLLNDKNLIGSVIYKDGLNIDYRNTILLLMTARYYGADILNYCEVRGFNKVNGKIASVSCYDKIGKRYITVKAKTFICTTGPFTDDIKKLNGEKKIISPSRGVHLVLDNFLNLKKGFLNPRTADNRLLFFLPFNKKLIIGSTDDYSPVKYFPIAKKNEVNFLLNEVRKYITEKISKEQIKSVWCSYRPLFNFTNQKSGDVPRSYKIEERGNLFYVVGGKWTLYKKMAEDTIKRIQRKFFIEKKPTPIPLIGTFNYHKNFYIDLMKEKHISKKHAKVLVERYGDRSSLLSSFNFLNREYYLCKEDVEYQIDYEMAVKPTDVLLRRTGIGFLDTKISFELLDEILNIFSKKFNWSGKQRDEEQKIAKNEMNFLKNITS